MILKGINDNDPLDIYIRDKQLFRVRKGEDLVWKRTPDTLTGYVKYYNYFGDDVLFSASHYPYVYLLDKAGDVIESTQVDSTGAYEFTNRYNLHHTRFVKVSTTCPHGGLSATSASAVSKIATEEPVIYWTPEWFLYEVGDVNGDGEITVDEPYTDENRIDDANWIFGRLLKPTDPDWRFYDADGNFRDWVFGVFYDPENTESNGRLFKYDSANSGIVDYRKEKSLYIAARCYGDVLGSYGVNLVT
jgi:hypothetical protein